MYASSVLVTPLASAPCEHARLLSTLVVSLSLLVLSVHLKHPSSLAFSHSHLFTFILSPSPLSPHLFIFTLTHCSPPPLRSPSPLHSPSHPCILTPLPSPLNLTPLLSPLHPHPFTLILSPSPFHPHPFTLTLTPSSHPGG